MPALRVVDVEKTYPGGDAALRGINLEVGDDEMMVLLGPSGCGKSTLLRILAGVEIPTRGRVFVGGKDVTDLPPQKRDIAMVFQNYALYPHMSVRDNLSFGLRMRRIGDRASVAQRVHEVAESLGLGELLDRKPAQLSGGQRQRVALGRAIARNPKLFLLDEPLSNLDVQLRVSTRHELARLHRSLRIPMVYVTHDQEEAMTLGDRIAVMRDGRLLQIDTPLNMYARPATRFVGGFVGSPQMNFFTAHVRRAADGGVGLEALDGALRMEAAAVGAAESLPDGRSCVVGIRPEDIEFTSTSEADVVAQVELIEPLGREVLIHVNAPGAQASASTPMRVLSAAETSVTTGSRVGLRIQRPRMHFFDPDTEKRLADPRVESTGPA